MYANYLMPARFKKIGWLLFIPSSILGFLTLVFDWTPSFLDFKVFGIFIDEISDSFQYFGTIENNVLNEVLGIFVIISAIMVAFSKEKNEDEFISNIRLQSLVWATYWNYGVLLLAFLLVYDISFLWVMIFNMFTLLILFIIRFNSSLSKLNKTVLHDE